MKTERGTSKIKASLSISVVVAVVALFNTAVAKGTTGVIPLPSDTTTFTIPLASLRGSLQDSTSRIVQSAYIVAAGEFDEARDIFFIDLNELKRMGGWDTGYTGSLAASDGSDSPIFPGSLPIGWRTIVPGVFQMYGAAHATTYNEFVASVYIQLSTATRAKIASPVTDLAQYKLCWAYDFIPSCETSLGYSFGFLTANSNSSRITAANTTFDAATAICTRTQNASAETVALTYSMHLADASFLNTSDIHRIVASSQMVGKPSLWLSATLTEDNMLLHGPGLFGGVKSFVSVSSPNATASPSLIDLYANGDGSGVFYDNATLKSSIGSKVVYFHADDDRNHTAICFVDDSSNAELFGVISFRRGTLAPETTVTSSSTTTAAPSTATTEPPSSSEGPVTIIPDRSVGRDVKPLGIWTIPTDNLIEDASGPLTKLSLEVINDTWLETVSVNFYSSQTPYDDPLGIYDYLGAHSIELSISGNILNLTFTRDKCFTPRLSSTVQVVVLNDSLASGAYIRPQLLEFDLLVPREVTEADDTTTSSALVIVGISCVSIGVSFLLKFWQQSITSLMQMQLLLAMGFTRCAPPEYFRVAREVQFVLWPLSDDQPSLAETDSARMVLNLSMVGFIAVLQIVVLLLFTCFGHDRSIEGAKSRTHFPGATLFFVFGVFNGSVFAAVHAIAMKSVGLPIGNSGKILTLSIVTVVFLLLLVMFVGIALFRLVARLVYKDGSFHRSFSARLIFGGEWQSFHALKRWGVVFEDVNGSSFWLFAAWLILCGMVAAVSGFTPGARDVCTKQYAILLVANGMSCIMMFLRRPFKSPVLNILNMLIVLLTFMAGLGLTTSMTCSRKGTSFSVTALWLALSAVLIKSVVVLLMSIAKTIISIGEVDRATYSSKVGQPKRHVEESDEQMSLVLPLDEKREEGSLLNVAYKPSLPLPVAVGPSVVCREIGYGARGGLKGSCGPSIAMQLSQPYGMCSTSDRVYIVDSGNHRVLAHDAGTRRIECIAGGNGAGYAGDHSSDVTQIKMNNPRCCAVGQRCLYVSDTDNDRVRRVDFASLQMQTVLGGNTSGIVLSRPIGLATSGDILYIADSMNHRLVALDLCQNVHCVVAGTGYAGYDGTGSAAAAARLNIPHGIDVCKATGTIFIADTGNHRVVCIEPVKKTLRTVLGTAGMAGETFTPRGCVYSAFVKLTLPTSVAALDDGSVIVVDGGNTKVWRVNRVGYAHVILPSSEHVLPRYVCLVSSSAGVVREKNASKKIADSSPSALSHSPQARQPLQSNSQIRFLVADSVNHIVAHVEVGSTGASEIDFDGNEIRALSDPMADLNSPSSKYLHKTTQGFAHSKIAKDGADELAAPLLHNAASVPASRSGPIIPIVREQVVRGPEEDGIESLSRKEQMHATNLADWRTAYL